MPELTQLEINRPATMSADRKKISIDPARLQHARLLDSLNPNSTLLRLIFSGIQASGLESVDYAPSETSAFLEKIIVRINSGLEELRTNEIVVDANSIWQQLDKERFTQLKASISRLDSLGLRPLLDASMLLLDVSKTGDREIRKSWEDQGIDLVVHNRASAQIVRQSGELSEVVQEHFKDKLTPEEQIILAELFTQMIAYHGFIGQHIRGEVTEHQFAGLTDWIWDNRPQLDEVLAKLNLENSSWLNSAQILTDLYMIVNQVDTASVRQGLYNNNLDQQFQEFGRIFNRTISQVVGGLAPSWDQIWQERLVEFGSKQVLLADRLIRLRGGRQQLTPAEIEEVEGLMIILAQKQTEVFEKIFDQLQHSQMWYPELATAGFDPEHQLKLLVLAATKAETSNELRDINFIGLVAEIYNGNKHPNKTMIRILDNMLYDLEWSDVFNQHLGEELRVNQDLSLKPVHRGGAGTEISLEISKELRNLVDMLESFYALDSESVCPIPEVVKQIETKVGLRLDNWDRGGLAQQSYVDLMNQSIAYKVEVVREAVNHLREANSKIVALGIGSGSGLQELALAQTLGQDDRVIATDASKVMVGLARRLERVVQARKAKGQQIADLQTCLLSASNLEKAVRDGLIEAPNLVMMISVLHEFASFLDQGHLGEETKNVLRQVLSILPKDGQVVIKDFVYPPDSNEPVFLKLLESSSDQLPPAKFLEVFVQGFVGREALEVVALAEQMLNQYQELAVPKWLAMEILGHYSWMKSGKSMDELSEKYGHFNSQEVVLLFEDLATKLGISVEIQVEVIDAGYKPHYSSGFRVQDLDGREIDEGLVFNGVVRVGRNAVGNLS